MITDVDVLIIGAGISGIAAAYHLRTHRPATTFTILDARDDIGGTWSLFRYPGIRSDSDMPTFGFGFKPWTNKKAIADAHTILNYLRETVTENDLAPHIQFDHRALAADFDTDTARWTVTAVRLDTGQSVEITCRFLFSGTGYYNYDAGFIPTSRESTTSPGA